MEKENYFTAENHEQKIQEWSAAIKKVQHRYSFQFSWKKSALLVIDMQNVFLDPNSSAYIPASTELIPQVKKLIKEFQNHRRPIYFSRHTTNPNKNDPMQRWWHNPINRNDPESEISSILTPSKKNTIIKHQYNVFIGTNLESKLKKHNIEQLVIVGVMTHLCCETTARDAFMRGYNVIFTIDGTASYREDFHLGTLRAISHGFGACFLIDDLLGEKIHEIYP